MDLSQKGKQDGETVKKSYKTPQVQVYGDLRELTNTTGKNGAVDANTKIMPQTGA